MLWIQSCAHEKTNTYKLNQCRKLGADIYENFFLLTAAAILFYCYFNEKDIWFRLIFFAGALSTMFTAYLVNYSLCSTTFNSGTGVTTYTYCTSSNILASSGLGFGEGILLFIFLIIVGRMFIFMINNEFGFLKK